MITTPLSNKEDLYFDSKGNLLENTSYKELLADKNIVYVAQVWSDKPRWFEVRMSDNGVYPVMDQISQVPAVVRMAYLLHR